MGSFAEEPPFFTEPFREDLARLFAWRRDVRRFRAEPVVPVLVEGLLDMAQLSPSVGNSQPWRWVSVESPGARQSVRTSFERCNARALGRYEGPRAALYARLKLEGLDVAPVQFAVFSAHDTVQGHGLGCSTMPETLDYSAVAAVMTFWLAARAAGLGVGWVSILDPDEVRAALSVPPDWRLVAYLCVGWPCEEHPDPELQRHAWQARTGAGRVVLRR